MFHDDADAEVVVKAARLPATADGEYSLSVLLGVISDLDNPEKIAGLSAEEVGMFRALLYELPASYRGRTLDVPPRLREMQKVSMLAIFCELLPDAIILTAAAAEADGTRHYIRFMNRKFTDDVGEALASEITRQLDSDRESRI